MAEKKMYRTYIERKPAEQPDDAVDTAVLEAEEREQRKREYIRKKRKIKKIKKIILGTLVILAVFAGNAVGRVQAQLNSILNKMNRDTSADLSNAAVDEDSLIYDKDVINILLVGSDKRASWSEPGRSDSTMIATLDLKNKRLKLTSLMRDMYVTIPGYGEDRFNAAYSFGGVKLLYETIALNFGIKMDGYAVVDFSAFKMVIHKLGGVEIELTDAEHHYLTTAYKKGSVLELKPGVNNMNGTQALAYTRIRQDAMGDFGRTERQRKVLQSIFGEVKAMSFSEIMNLGKEIMPYISTDITNKEIITCLKSVVMLGTTEIDQMRIPLDQSYTQKRIRKMAVLIPDMEVNKKALNDFIFNFDGK